MGSVPMTPAFYPRPRPWRRGDAHGVPCPCASPSHGGGREGETKKRPPSTLVLRPAGRLAVESGSPLQHHSSTDVPPCQAPRRGAGAERAGGARPEPPGGRSGGGEAARRGAKGGPRAAGSGEARRRADPAPTRGGGSGHSADRGPGGTRPQAGRTGGKSDRRDGRGPRRQAEPGADMAPVAASRRPGEAERGRGRRASGGRPPAREADRAQPEPPRGRTGPSTPQKCPAAAGHGRTGWGPTPREWPRGPRTASCGLRNRLASAT